jgi:RNA polymerase sigma-70 factor, ECF subfamily
LQARDVSTEHPPGEALDPDLALLAAVADGDGHAFERLVSRHQDRLVAVCERLLGNREDARDAAQDVFLKVYRGAAAFRPQGRVSTWLYRVAVNHCLNRMRRRKIAQFLSFGALGGDEPDAPEFDPPSDAPDPRQALESRQRWQVTRKTIDALPTNQRAVLVLAKFEGLAYKEIAEVLGITMGAVESRLFRAMRRLEQVQAALFGRAQEAIDRKAQEAPGPRVQ